MLDTHFWKSAEFKKKKKQFYQVFGKVLKAGTFLCLQCNCSIRCTLGHTGRANGTKQDIHNGLEHSYIRCMNLAASRPNSNANDQI